MERTSTFRAFRARAAALTAISLICFASAASGQITFISRDDTTLGSWKGVYGTLGDVIPGEQCHVDGQHHG